MAKPAVDIERMSRDERLALLERLWDSLSRDADALPLTAEQLAELDRRLDELEREGPSGVTPTDLRKGITSRQP
jgi:putative addiction module component (TIGR02574 family)